MARAKHILSGSGKEGFKLNLGNLDSILLSDDIINKPVIVISVAGAFRTGKSFLLDMMLRYLTASNKSEWLNENSMKGPGFPWQSGYKRHTTGILMWEKPFPVTLPTGEEAVIILVDTQGTFDNESTLHESSTVFALSTLLSSLQVFNLTGNLRSNDLVHLELFTEYGRMALEDGNAKPFQKLLFLVRDWQFDDQLPLGAEGGDRLVKECLDKEHDNEELAKVRRHIKDCFTEISGFLLPYPGRGVARNSKFDGNVEDMESEFVTGLKDLILKMLSPENLTIKTIAGNQVKAIDLHTFLTTYFRMLTSDELPKPKNILQATAEANNMAAVREAESQYLKEMEFLSHEHKKSLEPNELFRKHKEASAKAQEAYKSRKQMGDWRTSEKYFTQLTQDMEQWFKFAELANNTKREKEKLSAENLNINLARECKEIYVKEMQRVTEKNLGYVPLSDMGTAHETAKQKAVEQFDTHQVEFCGADHNNRFKLIESIDFELRQIIYYNDVKKDVKNQEAAQANMKAVSKAKKYYQKKMNKMTKGKSLSEEQLADRHKEVSESAAKLFESLKQGDEGIATVFLENMTGDLEHELNTYKGVNENKRLTEGLQEDIKALKQQLEDAKKPPRWDGTEIFGSKCNIL